MKFISNFILNNFEADKYNYIFIIHISRNFIIRDIKENERIYSLPNINPSINQLFIDNLEGNSKITLKDFLNKNIKEVLQENEDELSLIEEFNKLLINTLKNELNNTTLKYYEIDEDTDELNDFMNEEDEIKKIIIEIAYELMKDENCNVLIEKIIGEGFVNSYTIDKVSCLIDYIKNSIFNIYIKNVLLKLEDNNILTTLIELKYNNFKEIDKNGIVIKYLEEIPKDKNKAKPEP